MRQIDSFLNFRSGAEAAVQNCVRQIGFSQNYPSGAADAVQNWVRQIGFSQICPSGATDAVRSKVDESVVYIACLDDFSPNSLNISYH